MRKETFYICPVTDTDTTQHVGDNILCCKTSYWQECLGYCILNFVEGKKFFLPVPFDNKYLRTDHTYILRINKYNLCLHSYSCTTISGACNKMDLCRIRSIAFHPKAWNNGYHIGRSSDLFLLWRLPGLFSKTSGGWMPQHFSHSDGGIKLTATGIVPDFHGIPF